MPVRWQLIRADALHVREWEDAGVIYDTASKQQIGGFDSASPSGIFFTTRAARTGF